MVAPIGSCSVLSVCHNCGLSSTRHTEKVACSFFVEWSKNGAQIMSNRFESSSNRTWVAIVTDAETRRSSAQPSKHLAIMSVTIRRQNIDSKTDFEFSARLRTRVCGQWGYPIPIHNHSAELASLRRYTSTVVSQRLVTRAEKTNESSVISQLYDNHRPRPDWWS